MALTLKQKRNLEETKRRRPRVYERRKPTGIDPKLDRLNANLSPKSAAFFIRNARGRIIRVGSAQSKVLEQKQAGGSRGIKGTSRGSLPAGRGVVRGERTKSAFASVERVRTERAAKERAVRTAQVLRERKSIPKAKAQVRQPTPSTITPSTVFANITQPTRSPTRLARFGPAPSERQPRAVNFRDRVTSAITETKPQTLIERRKVKAEQTIKKAQKEESFIGGFVGQARADVAASAGFFVDPVGSAKRAAPSLLAAGTAVTTQQKGTGGFLFGPIIAGGLAVLPTATAKAVAARESKAEAGRLAGSAFVLGGQVASPFGGVKIAQALGTTGRTLSLERAVVTQTTRPTTLAGLEGATVTRRTAAPRALVELDGQLFTVRGKSASVIKQAPGITGTKRTRAAVTARLVGDETQVARGVLRSESQIGEVRGGAAGEIGTFEIATDLRGKGRRTIFGQFGAVSRRADTRAGQLEAFQTVTGRTVFPKRGQARPRAVSITRAEKFFELETRGTGKPIVDFETGRVTGLPERRELFRVSSITREGPDIGNIAKRLRQSRRGQFRLTQATQVRPETTLLKPSRRAPFTPETSLSNFLEAGGAAARRISGPRLGGFGRILGIGAGIGVGFGFGSRIGSALAQRASGIPSLRAERLPTTSEFLLPRSTERTLPGRITTTELTPTTTTTPGFPGFPGIPGFGFPTLPPFIIDAPPFLPAPGGRGGRKKGKGARSRRGFAPTLFSLGFGITGPRSKLGEFTGLGIRPVQKRRKRR